MDPTAELDPLGRSALRSLHDIVLPPAISWMPQTYGWGVLLAGAVLAVVVWAVFAVRRYKRNAYRREALALLDRLRDGADDDASLEEATSKLGGILKRTALAAYPRETVARLSGRGWVQFLSEHTDGADVEINALGQLFEEIEYRPQASMPPISTAAFAAARRWIERHHVSA